MTTALAARLAAATAVHIHQGGTQSTYCQQSLPLPPAATVVAWEDSSAATCTACRAYFPTHRHTRPTDSPTLSPLDGGSHRARLAPTTYVRPDRYADRLAAASDERAARYHGSNAHGR